MGVLLRRSRLPLLVLIALALGGGTAHAAHYNFTVSPDPPVEGQPTTFTFDGSMEDVERIRWDPDGDGDWDSSGRTRTQVTWTYATPGEVTARMRVEVDGAPDETVTQTFTVSAAPGPTAGFTFEPAAPSTGETVTFSSTSTPSSGEIEQYRWDLDGDGEFDVEDEDAEQVSWSYGTPGTYQVLLRVTQTNGKSSEAFSDVTVSAPPPADSPPPQETGGGGTVVTDPVGPIVIPDEGSSTRRFVRMRPFPVVRIAGMVLPRGALVEVLSVRVPRGARVTVRCRGAACPVGAVARTSATTRLLRFRKFERRLAAGTTLTLFIRQKNRIGKYTRFLIRAGKAPARTDRCLVPGRARPTRCP